MLTKKNLIEPMDPGTATRSRRVYQCTDEGRDAASRGALALVTDLQDVPHPFLVGLANLPLLSEREYAEALRGRMEQVTDRIEAVTVAARAQGPLPLPAREAFSYSLSLLEAKRSWLAERVQVPDD